MNVTTETCFDTHHPQRSSWPPISRNKINEKSRPFSPFVKPGVWVLATIGLWGLFVGVGYIVLHL